MLILRNTDKDLLLADTITVCETLPDRLRGLLGKTSLDQTEVYWIRPCDSIHTFFMRMTIDVAFVDANLTVVKVIANMTPFRVCLPVRRAAGVIEGPVGMLKRAQIRKGTQLGLAPAP